LSFHDVRFPERIALGAEGGPAFSTTIIASSGGHEQRQANWAAARRRWNVGTGLKQRADVEALIAFYLARQGRLHGFRFKDWSDYAMPRTAIGTTNGSTASFPLSKLYVSGGVTVSRRITRPVAGTVRCWVDGVERSAGGGPTEFQVNTATGVITLGDSLVALLAMPVEAQCEFDVPARFETDALGLTLRTHDIGEWSDIPVVEIRE
jgi:uncharacterized protein (TIGR02217 family)